MDCRWETEGATPALWPRSHHPGGSAMSTELWPANVSRLRELGIKYRWRKQEGDIELICLCEGRLILDETMPWHHCFGDIHCRARHLHFDEMVEALVGKAGKP
jgi:hypothetical protein